MSNIAILPEVLSNKIAAGEVVERPASVVKELLENALDAGCRRLTVDIEKGGKSRITVSDDGCGMIRDDALLSIERYATSKIRADEDLFDIRTLGFRGEALPSIASVSQFTLTTRAASQDTATRLSIRGGKLVEVSEVGAPAGTVVQVERLFFNTPARRKFLKSIGTEMSHIAETVSRTALAWPAVAFRLNHNGRSVKRWPAAPEPVYRVGDVLGKATRHHLLPLSLQNPEASVSGWAALPEITRNTYRSVYIYVNGRFVQDRMVRHALMEGYRGRLMKGKFPVAVLFIRVPFEKVDVNVHPTKHEVRFAKPREIHAAVQSAVLQAFGRYWKESATTFTAEPGKVPESGFPQRAPRWPGGIAENVSPYPNKTPNAPLQPEAPSIPAVPAPMEASPAASPADGEQGALWRHRRFSDLRIIGQFANTYLLCETENSLVVIDQHAAHERIYFEQLKNRQKGKKVRSQRLLTPETVELGFREAEILQRLIADLADYGMDIAPFGGNTFVVSAVPAMLADREIEPLLRGMLETIAEVGKADDLKHALEACLVTMACHAVIRAHQQLRVDEMQALLGQLDGCENPGNCPHGRPTFVEWPLATVEKAFGRIV
jgi:DNA mismatch repair protein MutL